MVSSRSPKVFHGESIRGIRIEENRFGFEPEIPAKVARSGCRIYDVVSVIRDEPMRKERIVAGRTAKDDLVILKYR